ncbi:hypothetical protein [Commensalibacter oyaizuii]|uniref:Restriction system protein Mrr-like N-terminal domain-containing protein n=1 Tax=Commensalibacter oyaizuii TaxID=3043873 RepID=A0ABT6Q3B8_9PROT|nr:hypothetical protein [Commensalibacter sp. TBRC 16381]MDI2091598.1 hypothetical protein [Commensalibacter sp. TBRC 16381]
MNFNKKLAFELLKDIANEYPEGVNTSLKQSEAFGSPTNPNALKKQKAYVEYLIQEGLVIKCDKSLRRTVTNKAINLLTDGMDMETWIKKNHSLN